MAMSWMSDVSQTAVAQEARQFALRHKDASFADVVARYALVKCDVLAIADRLLALSDEAFALRGRIDAAQGRYELESAQSRDAVGRAATWLRTLSLGAQYASVSGHPAGVHLRDLFAAKQFPADSWIQAVTSVNQALEQLSRDDLADYGLGAPFVAEGRAVAAALDAESQHPVADEGLRSAETERLHGVLEEIVTLFERVAAARELAMLVSRTEIPGFGLTFVRGAQAGPGTPPSDDKGL